MNFDVSNDASIKRTFSPFDSNLSAFRVAEVVESRLSNVRKNSLYQATFPKYGLLATWKNSGRTARASPVAENLLGYKVVNGK